jgi:sigma-E factor negative regulatory protein RseA
MSDKINEAISALVDNEASELEVHRAINQLKDSAEHREQWRRYHLVGAVLNDSHMANDTKDINLVGSISAQIDAEDALDQITPTHVEAKNTDESTTSAVTDIHPTRNNWLSFFAGGAVAASVALSVVLGFGVLEGEPLSSEGFANNGTIQSSGEFTSLQPVSTQAIASTVNSVDQQTLGANQRKLQQYLLEHANNPAFSNTQALTPFAQVASFESSHPLKNSYTKIDALKPATQ